MTTPSISYHLDWLNTRSSSRPVKMGQFVTYTLETTVLDESLGGFLT